MADVGAGTFYLHFPDKPAAFLAFTDQAASELLEHVHLQLAGKAEFRTQFAAALEAVLDYRDRHPGVLRAAFADEAVISTHLPGRSAWPLSWLKCSVSPWRGTRSTQITIRW